MYEQGVDVDVILGNRNKDLLIYEEKLKAVSGNLYVITDDGSYVKAAVEGYETSVRTENKVAVVGGGNIVIGDGKNVAKTIDEYLQK